MKRVCGEARRAVSFARAQDGETHDAAVHRARTGHDPKAARAKLRKWQGAAWKPLPEAELHTLISPSPARA